MPASGCHCQCRSWYPSLIHEPEVLCSKSDLQEILWNFSRLRGEGRLTLKQNPHFYKNLPASLEAYGCNFQTDPIENFLQARKIHVLTDKPGRVYLETPRHSRAFGNVWVPNDTIIFKGSYPAFLCFLLLMSSQTFTESLKAKVLSKHLSMPYYPIFGIAKNHRYLS